MAGQVPAICILTAALPEQRCSMRMFALCLRGGGVVSLALFHLKQIEARLSEMCYDPAEGDDGCKRFQRMQTLSTEIEDAKVRRLVEAARKAPVTLLEDGEPVAVVLSPEEFERLDEQDRIRREAKARLRQTMAAVQAKAAGQGLAQDGGPSVAYCLLAFARHAGRQNFLLRRSAVMNAPHTPQRRNCRPSNSA